MTKFFFTVGLLITALVGWSRCGLPPSNDITQNFLWNTGKFISTIIVIIIIVSVIVAVVELRSLLTSTERVFYRCGRMEDRRVGTVHPVRRHRTRREPRFTPQEDIVCHGHTRWNQTRGEWIRCLKLSAETYQLVTARRPYELIRFCDWLFRQKMIQRRFVFSLGDTRIDTIDVRVR